MSVPTGQKELRKREAFLQKTCSGHIFPLYLLVKDVSVSMFEQHLSNTIIKIKKNCCLHTASMQHQSCCFAISVLLSFMDTGQALTLVKNQNIQLISVCVMKHRLPQTETSLENRLWQKLLQYLSLAIKSVHTIVFNIGPLTPRFSVK